ncbi:BZ3500_MvSof-1268-A1-R1_Chr11-3g03540 [Microbotryum saponariae]|uniref:BZ3500_MvSof-1268-A1-R1_Chr11-3g03540 protein n=1 Tax=Microbotryum saponariae TaxID=289078 RepID=A0A2X0KMR2_9BASI|nr:BZ3500_MvSof-1268-A1-R1_Chr11-3g03540 [Microbotryum saponariae]SDA03549.1 BZ3501_MvSof-1269-A2-R1_Chr11g03117 [Microbotryum saponariae]
MMSHVGRLPCDQLQGPVLRPQHRIIQPIRQPFSVTGGHLFWAKVSTRTLPPSLCRSRPLLPFYQFGNRNRYDAVFVTAPTGSGKSVIFEAMYLIYGRRAVTIVVSPLNALRNHQAANLN